MEAHKVKLRAVIFDFDGVLVESASVKTQAFAELFQEYPHLLDQIINYHLSHAGVSRYVKIRWIYENIIRKPLSEDKLTYLADKFSGLVKEKVIQAPWVHGTLDLLSYLQPICYCFIASGTPQEELTEIVERRKSATLFTGVFGSPQTKENIVSQILETYSLTPPACLFVGDALTDLNAAIAHGLYFIGRITEENRHIWPAHVRCVHDMMELKQLLEDNLIG